MLSYITYTVHVRTCTFGTGTAVTTLET